MNQLDFQMTLDYCIGRIQNGESLARCLADYPEMATELRPLLTLSADLIDLEPLTPSAQGAQRGRDLMFAALDEPEENKNSFGFFALGTGNLGDLVKGWFGPAPQLGLVGRMALVIIGLLASGTIISSASANSLPGDQLYPVKLFVEETRLSLTFNPSRQIALQNQINERRLEEVEQLQAAGRTAEVEFRGQIEAITADGWIIDGLEVQPIPELLLTDEIIVGQTVTVNSQVDADGTILISGVDVADEPNALPIQIDPTSTPTQTVLPTVLPTSTSEPSETASLTATNTQIPAVQPTARPSQTPTLPALATAAATTTATEARPTENDVRPTDTQTPTQPPADRPSQTPSATPSPTVNQQSSPDAQSTRDIRATQAANSTRLANVQATQNANATRLANAQATQAANETRIANVQATQAANATRIANAQATQYALATQQANMQATHAARATEQANQQATRDALATEEANRQATRIAKATAAAAATQNAVPPATSTPTPEPTPTPITDVRPSPTPIRDG